MKFKIRPTRYFFRSYKKLVKKNKSLSNRVDQVIEQLKTNPFQSGLRSHQVGANKEIGTLWSSRVTGDIRIIWAFDRNENLIIILVKIGGHDDVY